MAREIVTRIWCDACLARDETYTEATETPPITIGAGKPRIMALCEVDMKDLFEPIRHALAEFGQIVPSAGTGVAAPRSTGSLPVAPPTAGIPCPLCGNVLKSRDSLNGHTSKRHGQTLNEVLVNNNITTLLDVNGAEVPAPRGADKVPEVTEVRCDQPGCGKVYAYPKYRRPGHALSIHLSQAHQIMKADRDKAEVAKKATPAKKTAARKK